MSSSSSSTTSSTACPVSSAGVSWAAGLRVMPDDALLAPLVSTTRFFVARRERAPLIFYRDDMDLRDLPNSWSMQCTEHSTARDALAHIAAQSDVELTRGATPRLYWQAVGGADETLHCLDDDTLLTDFVTSNERERRRIRLVVSFDSPRRATSPLARSNKASQLIGESPDVIRAVVSPPPGGGPLLRSVSSTTLRTKPSGGSPSLIKSASTDDAVARDDELRGALVFSSTSLTTSERECWRCHTWLAGDVVSAAGRHFHTDCFQCDECHASLLATLRFAFDEASDQRLCHACFIRRPAAAVVVAAAADVSPTVVVAAEPAPVVARVRQQQLGMHRTSFTLKSEQE